MTAKILYILPTYGKFGYAVRSLNSLERTTAAGYVHPLVIDDGSDQREWNVFREECAMIRNSGTRYHRFPTNGGLTRSWNEGLRVAKEGGYDYAICGNSDILFTRGWTEGLLDALRTFDLVGPVTNAPGHATTQRVSDYAGPCPTDDARELDALAEKLRASNYRPTPCPYINGFFMMARTDTWWRHAFDSENVFNPANKMTGNEDELQARMREKKARIAYAPRSFIFHYRSATRSHKLGRIDAGWYRRPGDAR